jgi:2-phosphosulfolactate phosphatase
MCRPESQGEYDLRLEWGLPGVRALAGTSRAAVIVDVLSFSTAVDIATARGAAVLPYRWRDRTAAEFASARGALLAEERRAGGYSLSPASLRRIEPGTALVLPSPNGSTLSLSAGPRVWTACLRNSRAVAQAMRRMGLPLAVIPAGEQWHEGGLRPAAEDLLGAGAVLAELGGRLSPEAESAVAAFERTRGRLGEALAGCVSGRELRARGFEEDIELAAEYAVSATAPFLRGDRFVADHTSGE